MGSFNPNIRSMTPVFDQIYQATAAANHASLYTVTDFSGKGICSHVGENFTAQDITDFYIQFTVDGATPVVLDTGAITSGHAVWNFSLILGSNSPKSINLLLLLEFDTSLKIEVANDNAATKNIVGGCAYHSFSEEYQRTLHAAGSQIPDAHDGNRPDAMPIDVMLVWYQSKDGSISNRMVVTLNKMPLIDEDAISGVIQKTQFETTLNSPLFSKVTDARDVQMDIGIKGYSYQADFVNGVLNPASLVLLDREIRKEDFMDRFTLNELEAVELKAETVPRLRAVMSKISYMDKINLDAGKLGQLLDYLVAQSIIDTSRKTEILA